MTIARKEIIITGVDDVYHCISRCVRRAFLCGYDKITKKNYDHRRDWIEARLKKLTKIFFIDVLNYAIMENHYHVLLKTKYSEIKNITDKEIALRWFKLYPPKNAKAKKILLKGLLGNPTRLKKLRDRLCSISWFMKSINEYIARLANKEDDCTGRFWEGRFKSQRIPEDGGILKCALYIDLNPIRAGKASTPEASQYTSVYERITEYISEKMNKKMDKNRKDDIKFFKGKRWLAPLYSDSSKQGILDISFEEYLSLLTWTGKEILSDKKGFIPANYKSILERFNLKTENWADSMLDFTKKFKYIIASQKNILKIAAKVNKHWFTGLNMAKKTFIT